ncbi:MAG: LPS export ABC transporter periplasmic protein LptC [Armatimonadota bacterium]|nr:LPS export ABC transporter periplasmic protein LptC [Armatimonadota bacterium]
MRARRWFLILIVVIAVPVVVWALLQTPAAPGRRGEEPAPTPTPSPQPTPRRTPVGIPPVRVEGSAISTVDPQGRQQWDLRAETVAVDSAAGTVSLVTVIGVFFEAGEPSVEFTAPRGTFFIASRNVVLRGGVRARAANGRSLEADTVKWVPGNRQIEASGRVVLRQSGMIVRSDRLVSDTSLERTRLTGNIRVTVSE